MNAPPENDGVLTTLLIGLGGLALLACMLTGTIGVIARHLGTTLVGDVELVQCAIVLTASVALVCATQAGRHARVHLLVNRVSAPVRRRLALASALLATLFFALLTIGLGWITLELRSAHEESELLHIPYAPLRWVALAATLTGTGLSLARAASRARQ